MIFELGKYYQHTTGKIIKIVGIADTWMWGRTFIVEDDKCRLSTAGETEGHSVNWTEITKEEWIKRMEDKNE